MTTSVRDVVVAKLNAIEFRMREIGCWSDERPSAEALASTLPFCYDTLDIEAWLQFIFIGRMRELIEQGDPLPDSCGIAPYIEMLGATGRVVDAEIVRLVGEIDREISGEFS